MANNIQEYLSMKKNPEIANFKALQDMKETARKMIAELLKEELPKIKEEIAKELKETIKDIVGNDGLVKLQGNPGKDGRTPTKGQDFFTPDDIEMITRISSNAARPVKGRDYIDGKDGRRGKQGIPGKDGRDGRPGPQGPEGLQGKDGSPDTPEDIKKKLQTLKGNERLDASAIKNIVIKQSGGGMGNVFAETPSGAINGSNKTFTLTNVPKNNSLIFMLNGQFLRNGSSFEYTLSGKTVTLTSAMSAPSGNDQVFAWYVRG